MVSAATGGSDTVVAALPSGQGGDEADGQK